MNTTTTPAKHLAPVTLGKTTYQVEYWADSDLTVLTGPRGAQYFLRGFLYRRGAVDTGLRQVISFKSGHGLDVEMVQRVYQESLLTPLVPAGT